MRILVGALMLGFTACSGPKEETRAPAGAAKLLSFDVLIEQSPQGLREVRFCGQEGSCQTPEPYPCEVIKRDPRGHEMLAKVTEAMSYPEQVTQTYLASFAGWEHTNGDRCVVELSGLSGVRRYS